MFPSSILDAAKAVIDKAASMDLKIGTVESCTGGLISGALTAVSGASAVVDRGFVTYSNQAKHDLVGVPSKIIEAHGAVSEETARAMAEGAVHHTPLDAAVAVTGIAGPGGGTPQKPVGLVYIAAARQGVESRVERHQFPGDRDAVRLASVERALILLSEVMG